MTKAERNKKLAEASRLVNEVKNSIPTSNSPTFNKHWKDAATQASKAINIFKQVNKEAT